VARANARGRGNTAATDEMHVGIAEGCGREGELSESDRVAWGRDIVVFFSNRVEH
jgi:hypothetical protein